jgi:hypothetical protein
MLADAATDLADQSARIGQTREAEAALEEYQRYFELSLKDTPSEGFARLAAKENLALARLRMQMGSGQESAAAVLAETEPLLTRLKSFPPGEPAGQQTLRPNLSLAEMLWEAYFHQARSALELGRYAEAETAARAARGISGLPSSGRDYGNLRFRIEFWSIHAQALVGLGRRAEARELLAPIVAAQRAARARLAAAPDNAIRRRNQAEILIATAEAQERSAPAERRALVTEARTLLDSLPAELAALADVRKLAARLAAEEAGLPRGD